MDAVVLANYATEHATFAIRCMNKGKHVLSEVLPCETMAQAVELIETVERTGLVYAYAENYCYMTHTFEMWRRYRTGELGMALYGEGEYIHDCSAIWPQITSSVVSYTFYAFELNVRASTVLGYVGAGGIGVKLNEALGLFKYERVSIIILFIFAVVVLVDALSEAIRRRLK